MSKPRLTFFGSQSSSNSDRPRSEQQRAHSVQPQKHFQIRKSATPQPEMEWQWGEEDHKLFQLQKDSSLSDATPRLRQQPSAAPNRSTDLDRWRRPESRNAASQLYDGVSTSTPAASTPVASTPAAPSSLIVGEILPAFDDTPLPVYSSNGKRAPTASEATYAPHNNRYRTSGNGHPPLSAATNSALLKPFSGEEGVRRVLATRIALDEALDRWWTNGEHAPLALLRDGLLALEAGHELDETQRSFLLRTALRTGRGIVTALQYQIDADRTAFLLKEALLDTKQPFDPNLINGLRQQDAQSEEWADFLEHDLAYEATVASGKRSQLAAVALQIMHSPGPTNGAPLSGSAFGKGQGGRGQEQVGVHSQALDLPSKRSFLRPNVGAWRRRTAPHTPEIMRPLSHRWSLRWPFWAILMLAMVWWLGWPALISSAPMVQIPAGTYQISDPASSAPADSDRNRAVTLAAFAIDRHEVTNLAYRRCLDQNMCPSPSSFDSQSRPGYFVNRAFNDFPVVNINWEAAKTYCAWVGKRLPTLEEWEVAASLAPQTGLRYTYPWGERFEMRVVNSALSGLNDTQAVGAYHPAGSTPLGIMDMAGNVAEWTSMPAASIIDAVVVKGGSFRDQPEQLRNDALMELQRSITEPWLGFRCASDQ